MAELGLAAIAVARDERPVYRDAAGLPDATQSASLARTMSRLYDIPVQRLAVLDGGAELPARALAALGAPDSAQPLALVQSTPSPEVIIMPLARLVHELGWPVSEDIGVTHLHELGGTAVLELLSWSVGGDGATAVIVDQPVYVEAGSQPSTVAAVALRVCGPDGPLRVLDWGEGAPAGEVARRFTGTGPCDAWLALRDALAAGELTDGDRVLLHTLGRHRDGWALLEIRDAAGVRLAGGGSDD